ncbi:DUF2150 family protein [Halalkalicoccus jeotgali]|uniref:DUF2150 family protein n=1 Tax=Halalkalicoccus jeotgali (strain DSM 18796 / CECT 7217 / JCM 14584 / KCTC 4019 / B3) TaxID=795797 RepID=D8JAL5_HALJB|nr:DUF2150 family protein [Halalkalicoccus jeotgali]ADJ14737.1 hypothetical protein HacjB3_06750 [Halalkalicoccus jeotgali B3]ELY39319.1 hypothetical protein C497_05157 [Halalkalicoccus jeotgali B3]
MSTPPEAFYSEERWQNWIDRLKAEDIDPEDEDSARLLLNLQDDAAIAVAKIVSAHEEGELSEEEAVEELAEVREIVLSDVEVENEETAFLIDGVQTSLVCVFAAAEEFILRGASEEATVEEYVHAAADAEAEEDFDAALGYCAQGGTRIIDGEDLDVSVGEEIEYGFVAEWVNGLDSLQSAMRDPEVIEEEDED